MKLKFTPIAPLVCRSVYMYTHRAEWYWQMLLSATGNQWQCCLGGNALVLTKTVWSAHWCQMFWIYAAYYKFFINICVTCAVISHWAYYWHWLSPCYRHHFKIGLSNRFKDVFGVVPTHSDLIDTASIKYSYQRLTGIVPRFHKP